MKRLIVIASILIAMVFQSCEVWVPVDGYYYPHGYYYYHDRDDRGRHEGEHHEHHEHEEHEHEEQE